MLGARPCAVAAPAGEHTCPARPPAHPAAERRGAGRGTQAASAISLHRFRPVAPSPAPRDGAGFMDAFVRSTLLIALAEMGDKSQLVSLAFASRFSWPVTLAGVSLATLLVHLGSVALGELLGVTLPTFWVRLAAGVAFVAFGLWTLRGDRYEPGNGGPSRVRPRFGPLLTVTGTFLLSELGDKTMLATVTLASQLEPWVGVWLGSTLGMVAADAVAILVGCVLGRRLPERAIRLVAATIFLGFGAVSIVQATQTTSVL
jgi:putative Ca2+/H+ antiporter (TMEM165/GDT1 family)